MAAMVMQMHHHVMLYRHYVTCYVLSVLMYTALLVCSQQQLFVIVLSMWWVVCSGTALSLSCYIGMCKCTGVQSYMHILLWWCQCFQRGGSVTYKNKHYLLKASYIPRSNFHVPFPNPFIIRYHFLLRLL
jgi:hypothetical protein